MSYFQLGASMDVTGQVEGKASSKKKKAPKGKSKGFLAQVVARKKGLAVGLGQKRPPGRAVGWDKAKLKSAGTRTTTPTRRPPTILTYPAPGTKSGSVTVTAPVLEPSAPVSPVTGGGGGGGSVWEDDATAAPDEAELDEETGDAITTAPEKKPMSAAAKLGIAAAVVGAGIWYWLEAKG